jgi:hypothetical protein
MEAVAFSPTTNKLPPVKFCRASTLKEIKSFKRKT